MNIAINNGKNPNWSLRQHPLEFQNTCKRVSQYKEKVTVQTKPFPPQIKLIFKPTMSWTDSQQALVHVYTVNIYIRMYQNIELTSRIVEVQATSFIL